MSPIEGRRALRCTYGGDGGLFPGRTAYIANPYSIAGRVEVLIAHPGGHVEKIWTDLGRLSNFHFETVPSEHPLHGHLPHGVEEHNRSTLEDQRGQQIGRS